MKTFFTSFVLASAALSLQSKTARAQIATQFAPGEAKNAAAEYVRFDIRDHIRIRVVPGAMTVVEFPDDLYEIEEIEDANKILQYKPLRATQAGKDQLIYSSFGITIGGAGLSADLLRKVARTTLSIYVRNKKDPAKNGWIVVEVTLDERTPHKVVRIEDVGGAAGDPLDLGFIEGGRGTGATARSRAKAKQRAAAIPEKVASKNIDDNSKTTVKPKLGADTFEAVRAIFGEAL